LAAPVAYALWQTLKVQNAALDAAFRPIPSPAQIEYQLRQEGYNPSLTEVLAVRQYLERQRNQGAILAAGITLSALYVAHRADHLF
jgi:hypothetical protein